MSGTVTFSGYNNIDWGSILDAVMQAESIPLTQMEEKVSDLEAKTTEFANLASKLGDLESAAEDLTSTSSYGGRAVSLSDSTAISASASSTAALGTYDVAVTKLARAQVTTLGTDGTTTIGDKDQTVVSTGGTLTFLDSQGNVLEDEDGNQVGLITLDAGSYTLDDLADAINSVDNLGVRATIVQTNGNYRLVMTGSETGAEHAFTLQNGLTTTFTLNTADAMTARDAEFTVNNVAITSASNTIEDAVPGLTFTLLKESEAGKSATMTVTQDTGTTRNKIKDFVSRFNALMDYVSKQRQAYLDGETDNIGSDALLRSLRGNLVSSISKTIGGGTYCNLAEIGIEFEQDGTISFDSNAFDDAVEADGDSVERLLSGFGSTKGVFQGVEATIQRYTEAGGLVPNAKDRNEDQIDKLQDQISQLEERLSIKAASLTAEYSAADQVMQTLNQQKSALTALLG